MQTFFTDSFQVNILMHLRRLEEGQTEMKELLERVLTGGNISERDHVELLSDPVDHVDELHFR